MGGRVIVAAAVLGVVVASGGAAMAAPVVGARAAIIMDAASGEVIWEKNPDEVLPPASTTKVMTAILALESGRLDDSLRVSSYASETAPSKIGLHPGQRMQLRNLLYALLLNSANDAATVIAEGLAGSEDAFAARMTARAHQLGASDARFANAHGLTAPGHEESARDLAILFRHGLTLPLFREILGTRTVQVPIEGGYQHVVLRSHNRLLTGYTYPVIGKTGYTRAARRCFVGAAQHDNREVIIALMGATDLWGDAKRLFGFAFGDASERPTVVMAGMLPLPSLGRRTAGRPAAERSRRNAAERAGEGDEEEIRASSGDGRYAVQLGPYATRHTAAATQAKLARHGYSAVWSGRALRLGSFSTQALAQQLALRLRRVGYNQTVVALR